MKEITIFTDGASRGTPGPGGWAAVIRTESKVVEIGGREEHTTNNRMELRAAIEALKYLEFGNHYWSLVTIYSDSHYLINGITKWIFDWQKKNWRTRARKAVLNQDLWEELSVLVEKKNIEWKYVAGHSGVESNERADQIATAFADSSLFFL